MLEVWLCQMIGVKIKKMKQRMLRSRTQRHAYKDLVHVPKEDDRTEDTTEDHNNLLLS